MRRNPTTIRTAATLSVILFSLSVLAGISISNNAASAAADNMARVSAARNAPNSSPSPTPCTGPNVIQNPGFESGSFAPWVISDTLAPAVISTTQTHSGAYSALIGNLSGPEPNGDGSIYQTITVPPGGGTLSYWYWPANNAHIDFDWQDAYVENTTGTILAVIMHREDNSLTWTPISFNMTPYAGQTVRIVFLVHEDGFGDPTAMYVDDVSLSDSSTCITPTTTPTASPSVGATDTPTSTPTPCTGPNVIQNPGFESGSFAPWVISDTNAPAVISTTHTHSGAYSTLIGNLSGPEPNGDGSIYQTITVPAGGGTLSYWYWPSGTDTISFDWQDVYVENTTGTILAIIMHRADNSQAWVPFSFNMTPYAGQTVRIVFLVYEDGFGDDTAMFVDDVSLHDSSACITPTATPSASVTGTPTLSATSAPTNTPVPTDTPTVPTSTPMPTDTLAAPTSTAVPTDTPAIPTDTPIAPTNTLPPTATPLPATMTPTDCPNPFVDITGNVFYGAIHYLACRGVVNGTDATHYGPSGTSTRGQFAKVVVLGFGLPFYTPATPDFSDVPATYFAYLYIETGFHAGILSGFDAATCQANGLLPPCYLPNRAITRAELTRLVVNAAGYALYTPTVPDFTDVPPTNVFYVSIETAFHNALVGGYPDRTFRPNNNIRRDEMAQIVFKGVTAP